MRVRRSRQSDMVEHAKVTSAVEEGHDVDSIMRLMWMALDVLSVLVMDTML